MDNSPYQCTSLDSIWPPVIQRWILCFACSDHQKQRVIQLLRDSFAMTLRQTPLLAGRLRRDDPKGEGERLVIVHPEDIGDSVEVQFIVKDMSDDCGVWKHTYEGLRDMEMPISFMLPDKLEPSFTLDLLKQLPIAVQVNLIPGGCLLYICLSHSIFDGAGAATLIGTWAKHCSSIQQKASEHAEANHLGDALLQTSKIPNVFHDSFRPTSEEANCMSNDPFMWRLLGLRKPPVDSNNPPQQPFATEPLVSAIFSASRSQIEAMKSAYTAERLGSSESVDSTTFEVMTALLWRSVMRARHEDGQQNLGGNTRLRIPVNVRKALLVDSNYPGNVLLNSVTEMPLEKVMLSSNTNDIVSEIHSSIKLASDSARARDAIKLSFVLPPLEERRPLFKSTTGNDIVLTSWKSMPLLQHNWGPAFGEGSPDFVRIPAGNLPSICALLPASKDGDVDVLVSVTHAQLERLKADILFTKYFGLKCV